MITGPFARLRNEIADRLCSRKHLQEVTRNLGPLNLHDARWLKRIVDEMLAEAEREEARKQAHEIGPPKPASE